MLTVPSNAAGPSLHERNWEKQITCEQSRKLLGGCRVHACLSTSPTDAQGLGVSRPTLLVRAGLLMTSYFLALMVPRFSLLMGLTGSVTGAAMTLIMPCLCHLRLYRGQLTGKEQVTDVCILITGIVCSISGLFCSVKRLLVSL